MIPVVRWICTSAELQVGVKELQGYCSFDFSFVIMMQEYMLKSTQSTEMKRLSWKIKYNLEINGLSPTTPFMPGLYTVQAVQKTKSFI